MKIPFCLDEIKSSWKSNHKDFLFRGDGWLWVVIMILMMLSLFVIYSSTGRLAFQKHNGDTSFFLRKQLVLYVFGYAIILFFTKIPFKYYLKYAYWFLGFSVLLLLYASFSGHAINGAGRWIKLLGFTFQPSELAKITTVMVMARVICLSRESSWYKFNWADMICPLSVIAIIFFDNVSTAGLLFIACYLMLFMGRIKTKMFIKITGVITLFLVLFLSLVMFTPASIRDKMTEVSVLKRIPTFHNRIVNFFDDTPDDDNNFQLQQAKIAVAKGGIRGSGPGNSTQRNFLPHPYSDFIFAIILEEYGLAGCLVIFLTFLVIAVRIGVIVSRCTRVFPALLVMGLGVTIVLQALIHMLVNVGLFPVTGQTLPLVSMGGTSLWLTCMSLGIILRISYEFSPKYEEDLERMFKEEGGEPEEDEKQNPSEDYYSEDTTSGDTDYKGNSSEVTDYGDVSYDDSSHENKYSDDKYSDDDVSSSNMYKNRDVIDDNIPDDIKEMLNRSKDEY